jgi:Tfp pilus assembly protein PilV
MRGKALGARGEGGFTLIETSVALLVMLVAGLAAASLFVYAIKYNTGASDRAVAQALAQRQMETVRVMEFADIADSSQTVASLGRQFTVAVTVCNDATALCGGSASVKRVTVTVTPTSAGPVWSLNPVMLITLRGDTATGNYF